MPEKYESQIPPLGPIIKPPGNETASLPTKLSINAQALAKNDEEALATIRKELLTMQAQRDFSPPAPKQERRPQLTEDTRNVTSSIAQIRETITTATEPIVQKAKIIGQQCQEKFGMTTDWGNRLTNYFQKNVNSLKTEMNDRPLEWQRNIYAVSIPAHEVALKIVHSPAFDMALSTIENVFSIRGGMPPILRLASPV